jgi:hypothetical protein
MESENCSPIVPEVPWSTGAVDLDYWCKVERERVTTSHVHTSNMHLNDQSHQVFVMVMNPSTTISIPNEDKNYPNCTCMCGGQKRRGLPRLYACSALLRLEADSWFSNKNTTANHSWFEGKKYLHTSYCWTDVDKMTRLDGPVLWKYLFKKCKFVYIYTKNLQTTILLR